MFREQYDEEELALLQEQERFLSSGEQSSAKVTRAPNLNDEEKPLVFEKEKVVFEIVEKNFDSNSFVAPSKAQTTTSFPKARHRSKFANRYAKSKTIENNSDQKSSSNVESDTKEFAVNLSDNISIKYSKLEEEKMKWQEDAPVTKIEENKLIIDGSDKWRFDFQGVLLEGKIDEKILSKNELYNHGKEPDRPGYTIEELLYLSRSTFPQQRTIALHTLAAIVKNAKKHIYVIPGNKRNENNQELREFTFFY